MGLSVGLEGNGEGKMLPPKEFETRTVHTVADYAIPDPTEHHSMFNDLLNYSFTHYQEHN